MDHNSSDKILLQKIKDLEDTIKAMKSNEAPLKMEISELRKIKEYYDILMQNTEDYFLICDQNGVPRAFNDSYRKKIEELIDSEMKPGMEPLHLVRQDFNNMQIEMARQREESKMRVLNGEKFKVEYGGMLYENETIYFETLYCPITHDGEITGFTEITRIITQHKMTETALRESASFNSSLLENSPNAILVLNPDTSIRYVNTVFENLTGYSSDDVIGKKVPYPWWVDDPAYGSLKEKSILFKKGIKRAERRFKKKNGEISWVEINITPIYRNDTMIYSLATWVDISERKEIERQRKDLEEKLQRSQKMESLGLLAGGVAHDLNNVLSGIVSYPDLLLLDLPEDSRLRKPILTMKESGDRAVSIVQDLLTIARGVATVKKPLNLNGLINEYSESPEFMKLKQYHPSVTFEKDLDTSILNIHGSAIHLRKAVMNIVSNASEAIESEGRVQIATRNLYLDRPLKAYDNVKPGEYVVLSVSDNGPGVSQEDIKRIFEPFYSKKIMGRSGTGLGLSVVWNIMQDHNGYINVSSNDRTTTFDLYFPATREKAIGEILERPIEDIKGNGEKILVIDDMQSQRDITGSMLERLGYEVATAPGGEMALEYLSSHAADLIVLDMIMDPGINGRETYERIIKIHPGQKAIIVSGFAETDEVKATQKMGAGEFIRKPLTTWNLGTAVKEELSKP